MGKKPDTSAYQPFDKTNFVHASQVGGIESYRFDNGAGGFQVSDPSARPAPKRRPRRT